MTEEEKQDEPLEEFPENPEEVKETPKPTETVEPTRFDGLSKEELLKIVKDQDSYVGEKNQEIGDLKKEVILSTGMADISEIEEAVLTARNAGAKDIVLLKCVSSYPANPEGC